MTSPSYRTEGNARDQMDEAGMYGQFGQAVYDQEDGQWRFERSQGGQYAFQPLGESWTVISPIAASNFPNHVGEGKEGSSRRRQNQAKVLVQTHPEIQPASTLLADLARVSEAVEDAATQHDSAKGNLIAFGNISDKGQKRLARVTAFPTGRTGSDLRIIQVMKQKRGWPDSQNVWLDVPTMFGEEAIWKGPGVPIQSVTFAPPRERGGDLLAVRLITQTIVFQPVLRKLPLPNSSRLEINYLLSFDSSATGDMPHAGVTFNPWSTRQLGIVDQMGNWSTWEVQGLKSGQVERMCRSVMIKLSSGPRGKRTDDGWGRISWICNSNMIAVCDRRVLKVFDIAQNEPRELENIEIGIETGFCWILDMVVLPSRPNFSWVLTSTHIRAYFLDPNHESNAAAKNVVKIRHFRNEQDISLRLYLFVDEDDVVLTIRSDIHSGVTCYRLHCTNLHDVDVGDPMELCVSNRTTPNDGLLALHIEPASLVTKADLDADGDTTRDQRNKDVRFYSMSMLLKDLSVAHRLYFACSAADFRVHVEPTSWESELVITAPKSEAKVLDEEDGFMVDGEQLGDDSNKLTRNEPVSAFVQRRREHVESRSGADWTVNYELTVRQLNNVDVSEVTDISEVLEKAQSAVKAVCPDNTAPFRTLRELTEGEIRVRDTEDALTGIEELEFGEPDSPRHIKMEDTDEQLEPTLRMGLRPVALPASVDVPASQGPDTLSSLYDSIVDNWIAPIADDLPDEARLSKEQHARRMAAEVALASQVLRPTEPKAQQVTQSESQSQSHARELPIRPPLTPSSSRATPSPYFDASSQPQSPAQARRSASATPSATTGSSFPSTLSGPEISRLSHYTTFSGKPAPPPLPRRFNRVLAHWTPGANPASYDWLTASQHLSQRDEEQTEGDEMTEKERKRKDGRIEKRLRKQRREAEEGQRQQMLSSQAPEIMTASRPASVSRANRQPAVLEREGQSQEASQPIASQVLPGRHGGRPPARKKRKSGF